MNLINIITGSISPLKRHQDQPKASESTEAPLTSYKPIRGRSVKTSSHERLSPVSPRDLLLLPSASPPAVATRWGSEAPVPAEPGALRPRRAQPEPARGIRERSWKPGRTALLPSCCKLGEGKQLRVLLVRRWGEKESVQSFLQGWLGGAASWPVFGVKPAIQLGVVGL